MEKWDFPNSDFSFAPVPLSFFSQDAAGFKGWEFPQLISSWDTCWDPALAWASGRVVPRCPGDCGWKRALPTLDMADGRKVLDDQPQKMGSIEMTFQSHFKSGLGPRETDRPSGKICVSRSCEYDETISNMWVRARTTAKSDVHPNVDDTWWFLGWVPFYPVQWCPPPLEISRWLHIHHESSLRCLCIYIYIHIVHR